MIKIEELRVGNWVLWNGEYVNVYGLEKALERFERTKINDLYIEDFEPIPLTEELLTEKCGFEDEDGGFGRWLRLDYDIHNKNRHMLYKIGIERIEMCSKGMTTADAPLKHLHQLQNLYFALTGQELPVTL